MTVNETAYPKLQDRLDQDQSGAIVLFDLPFSILSILSILSLPLQVRGNQRKSSGKIRERMAGRRETALTEKCVWCGKGVPTAMVQIIHHGVLCDACSAHGIAPAHIEHPACPECGDPVKGPLMLCKKCESQLDPNSINLQKAFSHEEPLHHVDAKCHWCGETSGISALRVELFSDPNACLSPLLCRKCAQSKHIPIASTHISSIPLIICPECGDNFPAAEQSENLTCKNCFAQPRSSS